MTITATELARVRYWVQATWEPAALFNDAAVSAVWDREADTDATTSTEAAETQSWANVYRTAYYLTQVMVTGFVAQPDSFSVGGEYSESRGAAFNMLMNRLSDLTKLRDNAIAEVEGTNVLVTTQAVRVNFYGR